MILYVSFHFTEKFIFTTENSNVKQMCHLFSRCRLLHNLRSSSQNVVPSFDPCVILNTTSPKRLNDKEKRVCANDFATVIKMAISVDTSWTIWYMAVIQALILRLRYALDISIILQIASQWFIYKLTVHASYRKLLAVSLTMEIIFHL